MYWDKYGAEFVATVNLCGKPVTGPTCDLGLERDPTSDTAWRDRNQKVDISTLGRIKTTEKNHIMIPNDILLDS